MTCSKSKYEGKGAVPTIAELKAEMNALGLDRVAADTRAVVEGCIGLYVCIELEHFWRASTSWLKGGELGVMASIWGDEVKCILALWWTNVCITSILAEEQNHTWSAGRCWRGQGQDKSLPSL